MDGAKEKSSEKDSNGESSTESKGKLPTARAARGTWNVIPVRSKMSDRCFWSACKAMVAGFLFLIVGAGMATLGFYSDHLSRVEETKGNTTIWVKNESKDSHLASLTYLGPVVMGIGGFTIVAACVMTFEARDTAAKIVPIWFKRTRIHVVSGGSGSTPSGRSSKASWEKFLSQQKSTEYVNETRTAMTQALVNFSKYLQNSVDTNKILQRYSSDGNQQSVGLRKCPSEPNLVKPQRDANGNNISEAVPLHEASTPQLPQRTNYGGGLKPMTGTSKPQLLSVAPDTYRQAVSMDCPRSNRYDEEDKETNITMPVPSTGPQISDKIKIQTLPFQTSCATSSSGSMSVDIYLPQGAVTLKIHDDMKDQKRSPLKPADSDESHYTKFSQQSELPSFENDEELLSGELDDSVFINPEYGFSAPKIIFDALEPKKEGGFDNLENIDNRISFLDNNNSSAVEHWATGYQSAYPLTENKSDSLEIQTPEGSPLSPVFSPNYSFDYSEANSPGLSVDSVISNPFSSRKCTQPSLSQTDTSFINVSSLNSMGASQDISSPLVFCGSPKGFDYEPMESASANPKKSGILGGDNLADFSLSRIPSFPETRHVSINLEPDTNGKSQKTSPRKHSSLESAQITSSKTRPPSSTSPKRHQLSLEGSNVKSPDDTFLIPPMSPRFLSPKPASPMTSPTALTFSPRKTRSESLPERRQAPSIKRFPLMRQGALDSCVEEGGSRHQLDRSMTQIYKKDP